MRKTYGKEILELRSQGMSVRKIAKELGCSTASVSYHIDGNLEKNREKKRARAAKFREKFNEYYFLYGRMSNFQKRGVHKIDNKDGELAFTFETFKSKIEENPYCYLSGRKLDVSKPNQWHLDHIIPVTRGGSNSIENMGLLDKTLNKMKHNLTPEEFIEICKEVLNHNGYDVAKRTNE